jgi:hypothetical protein
MSRAVSQNLLRARTLCSIMNEGTKPAERISVTMKYTYVPQGVCARLIEFELEDGIVKNLTFTRGCNGNTQGIGRLA